MKKFLFFIIFTIFYPTFSYAEIFAYKCLAKVGEEMTPEITFIIDTKKKKIFTPEGNEMEDISITKEVFVFKSTENYGGESAIVESMWFFISRANNNFVVTFFYIPEKNYEPLRAFGKCQKV